MADPELHPLVQQRHCVPLEVRAAELIAQGAGICLAPPADELDLTHELGSSLYALHIMERHDRARGSARAAAFRASESVRTRAALRDHALATLDAALEYVTGPGEETKDDDDDDVLLISRPLPVKERYTTSESRVPIPIARLLRIRCASSVLAVLACPARWLVAVAAGQGHRPSGVDKSWTEVAAVTLSRPKEASELCRLFGLPIAPAAQG